MGWSEPWEPCEILPGQMQNPALGRKKPMQWYKLRTDCVGSSPAENDLVDLVDSKLPCALAALKVNSIMGCVKRSTARRSREVIIPLHSAVMRWHLVYCIVFLLPYNRDIAKLEQAQWRATRMLRAGASALQGEAEGWSCFSLEKGRLWGAPQSSFPLATSRSLRRQRQALHSSAWWQEERWWA